ncbi:MAG: adenylyl-sulfate kinase [Actinobacteria bacterium]|nr:adenylyl-sulfate kinase [Actinomycetota bacterium]
MSTGQTIWFTGLSGAGKTTTARALAESLAPQHASLLIDGDVLRSGLSRDLGFSSEDRAEQVRRAGEVAIVAAQQGIISVVSLVSPKADPRALVRTRHADEGVPFTEIYVATPLAVCIQRDPKSLYARAAQGSVDQMTGVSDPYEVPNDPDIVIETHNFSTADIVEQLRAQLHWN